MIIYIKAKPNSKEEKIAKVSENEFVIWTKEKAEDNKANIRIINMLAKELDVNAKNIKIKNPKSRNKIVEIVAES